MKTYIDKLSNEIIEPTETRNVDALADNWYTDEQVAEMQGGHTLLGRFDDGRPEGAVWFPLEPVAS